MKKYLKKSYFFLFIIYFFYSYVLTDPNLTILNFAPFLKFQNFLWQNILPDQILRTSIYLILIFLLFLNYFLIINNFEKLKINSKKKLFKFILLLSIPLVFSYNALSYDIFNYIFNEKILVHYCANPHVKVALDFSNDNWTRFMNNTHTPAPYGYGWTAISVIPYLLGFGKFLTTWLSFKAFSLLGLIISFYLLSEILKKENKKDSWKELAVLFLNPLLLIEFLSNGHNDFWMLWPAILSIYYAKYKKKNFINILSVFILIIFSITIKFSTLAISPLIIYLLFKENFEKIKVLAKINKLIQKYFYDFASILMFIPLFTARSRQFLPWYLLWSFIFYPLVKIKIWKELLIIFTISSLIRYLPWMIYLPWMSFGVNNSGLITYQKIITWSIPLFYLLIKGLILFFNRDSEK